VEEEDASRYQVILRRGRPAPPRLTAKSLALPRFSRSKPGCIGGGDSLNFKTRTTGKLWTATLTTHVPASLPERSLPVENIADRAVSTRSGIGVFPVAKIFRIMRRDGVREGGRPKVSVVLVEKHQWNSPHPIHPGVLKREKTEGAPMDFARPIPGRCLARHRRQMTWVSAWHLPSSTRASLIPPQCRLTTMLLPEAVTRL